jgi:hypothetical protein
VKAGNWGKVKDASEALRHWPTEAYRQLAPGFTETKASVSDHKWGTLSPKPLQRTCVLLADLAEK